MSMTKPFAYAMLPMDFGWERFVGIDAYRNGQAGDAKLGEPDFAVIEGFERFVEAAYQAAREVRWEGDFRTPPHVGFLPNAEGGEPIPFLVWKQDNNGTTFVVSPVELPYLKD